MNINTIKSSALDEDVYVYEHQNGLKTFVMPKKGYAKKHAAFCVHFGSINNEFKTPKNTDIVKVPDGIAHFLEHKLFEQNGENAMELFSKLGAQSNAYTNFNQTVYLFSCIYNFEQNFNLLMNFVQTPYFTEDDIEKEKGIISQEINMYNDTPDWRVFFNLLGALYKEHPVKIDIGGTMESIANINKDMLYDCYNSFYVPNNMIIVVIGDVRPEEVFEQVNKNMKFQNKVCATKILKDDGSQINKPFISQKLKVSMPMFQMGFKDEVSSIVGEHRMKREIAVEILLQMIMGESSNLYNKLYQDGLINSTFNSGYTIEENYGFSIFGGESPDPVKVRESVEQSIKEYSQNGLNKQDFERILKKLKGSYIKIFNSIERTSKAFISSYFNQLSLLEYINAYNNIDFKYISNIFDQHFVIDRLALSVIESN